MAFKDFPDQEQGVQLLQRSLDRGRLAHGYLFTGHHLSVLEGVARSLAKTLNCQNPTRGGAGVAIDCCDQCPTCRKLENDNHADVHWVRPESKSRVIVIDQMRDLMQVMNLKPTEAEYKVAIVVAADRLNVQAANAFLKTLEEPPTRSVLMLLTTEPQRLLDTILSRCLRLNFSGEALKDLAPQKMEWLTQFSDMAAQEQKSLLGRYRLLDVLVKQLAGTRETIEADLTARSPLERHDDVEKDLRNKWEDELTAAIEAEYRRERSDLVVLLEWWLRDVWLQSMWLKLPASAPVRETAEGLLSFPRLTATQTVARRVKPEQAIANLEQLEELQRLLATNVQEALALEVALLKLHL